MSDKSSKLSATATNVIQKLSRARQLQQHWKQ